MQRKCARTARLLHAHEKVRSMSSHGGRKHLSPPQPKPAGPSSSLLPRLAFFFFAGAPLKDASCSWYSLLATACSNFFLSSFSVLLSSHCDKGALWRLVRAASRSRSGKWGQSLVFSAGVYLDVGEIANAARDDSQEHNCCPEQCRDRPVSYGERRRLLGKSSAGWNLQFKLTEPVKVAQDTQAEEADAARINYQDMLEQVDMRS